MSREPLPNSDLFGPLKVGRLTLQHRIVLAPLTRLRAHRDTYVPVVPLVKDYYAQRASTPGTLLITEGTAIALKAQGYTNVPGIFSPEQIEAWKEITDAVHANGSFIYMQLWAAGRGVDPSFFSSANCGPGWLVAPSPIPLSYRPRPVPRELSIPEIHEYIDLFAEAAWNAVYKAGFDGVEMHATNGYLIDQFLQSVSNERTDEYGGNVENRSRFGLEAVKAVVARVGEERTGVRVGPWSMYQEMRMPDPVPQFTHFVSALKDAHPNLAYMSVIEPRVSGNDDKKIEPEEEESNDFLRKIWSPRPLISAGGYTRESAMKRANSGVEAIAFGRHFLANPDLPRRLRENIPLNQYDRATFYVTGDQPNAGVGYNDYTFAWEEEAGRYIMRQS